MRPPEAVGTPDVRRSLVAAILLGIGMMAAIDEIVFHQVLAWHHFFDRATPAFGLLSDGLLHSAELVLLVLGFFMFGDLWTRHALARQHALAGFFYGMGGFQLFDGTVNHKLLGLHQIRYVDYILPYDLAWNGFAIVLLALGFALARPARAGQSSSPPGRRP